jgi:tripartite ATP-independent transporter DctP family solute receptor
MRPVTFAFCAALTAIGLGAAPVQAQTTLRLAHQFAPDSLPGKSAQRFAELVQSKSGGATRISVLPGGALGDERANLQQLGSGTIDLALTGDLVISALARPYMIVSMPFIYSSPDHSLAVFNGPIGEEIGSYLVKEHKIRPLGWQYVGTRVLTSRTPVTSLAELKGLRLRLAPAEMWVKTWEKTGVGIASIAFTELYLALQTGTVAAQENPPNFIRAQKFNEVQRYLMATDHVPQMQVYFASEQKLASFDEKTRKVLAEAAAEATAWTTQQAKESQASDIAWLTGPGGMQTVAIDMTGIGDLIKSVPEEVLGAEGKKLYERIVAAKP